MSTPSEVDLFRSPQEIPIRSLRGFIAEAVSGLLARTDSGPSRNPLFIASSDEPNEWRISSAAFTFFDVLDSMEHATDARPGTLGDQPQPAFTTSGELLVDLRSLPDHLSEYAPQANLGADVESRLLIEAIRERALRDADERPGIPPAPQSVMPPGDRM